MNDVSWDDIRIFIQVARCGSLSGAAERTGQSAATVGRRMLALERQLARTLFVRRQTGYTLTDDGDRLLGKAFAMEAGARPIADWLDSEGARPVVRISAGHWTSNFMAENFGRLWTPDDNFRIGFKTTARRLDIAHREVEIGVRNQRPDSNNLAGRRTVQVALAPFRARTLSTAARNDWVAIAQEDMATPSARWVNAQADLSVSVWASTPATLADLIRAGAGIGMLPCFTGDRDSRLERAGLPVPDLEESQWIVMHNVDRHRPEVRSVIDRLVALFTEHSALFAGQRPLGSSQPH